MDKKSERWRRYYLLHRERKILQAMNWKLSHRDKVKISNRKSRKKYYEAHRQIVIEYIKKWARKNPEYVSYWSRMRKARMKGAQGKYTLAEWLELKRNYNNRCPSCFKSEPHIKLTVDHILPIVYGGTNDISNIQPLCFSCNSRKGSRLFVSYPAYKTSQNNFPT